MESVMDMARGAFGGDTLARISAWLGESPAATKAAVQDVLPASMVGLANQASTEEGSRALLGRFQRGDYPHLEPDELGRAVTDPATTDRLVQTSQGFMGNLFGGKTGSIVDGIAEHVGISRAAISKLLGLAAPLVLGMIGKRTMADHLDAGGLRNLLGEQRNIAAGMLPGSLSKILAPTGPTAVPLPSRGVPVAARPAVVEHRRAFPWWLAGLAAVIALGAFALSRMRNREADRPVVTSQVSAPSAAVGAGNMSALTGFLDSDAPLPQRFLLDNLTFNTDSAEIAPGSRQVLDDLAGVLVTHRTTKIRIDGHTDNTGELGANRQLSQARAESAKRYLSERGVDANRIATTGYGAERPIASNDTPAGRAENRRTEVVVTER